MPPPLGAEGSGVRGGIRGPLPSASPHPATHPLHHRQEAWAADGAPSPLTTTPPPRASSRAIAAPRTWPAGWQVICQSLSPGPGGQQWHGCRTAAAHPLEEGVHGWLAVCRQIATRHQVWQRPMGFGGMRHSGRPAGRVAWTFAWRGAGWAESPKPRCQGLLRAGARWRVPPGAPLPTRTGRQARRGGPGAGRRLGLCGTATGQ